MRTDRLDDYRRLEESRSSRLLVYVTGDRQGLETRIHPEVLNYFTDHLDKIGDVDKISLLLYTRGGDTLASWSIANLIRQFCKSFEVIIPSKCHSGGTLISLAADTSL
jgi:ClpP class serine protease